MQCPVVVLTHLLGIPRTHSRVERTPDVKVKCTFGIPLPPTVRARAPVARSGSSVRGARCVCACACLSHSLTHLLVVSRSQAAPSTRVKIAKIVAPQKHKTYLITFCSGVPQRLSATTVVGPPCIYAPQVEHRPKLENADRRRCWCTYWGLGRHAKSMHTA
jgi:hypothetical protein